MIVSMIQSIAGACAGFLSTVLIYNYLSTYKANGANKKIKEEGNEKLYCLLCIRTDLGMTLGNFSFKIGKIIAQCCHATTGCIEKCVKNDIGKFFIIFRYI